MNTKNISLLAPAGSYESLQSAIDAGCHAVYFGITQLNMRARSSANFTLEDLRNIADICHKNNVRGYLTMNTLLYDHDIILARKIMDTAKESGIDAVIAADVAAIQYAKSIGIEVHISTQLSISNIEGVRFWAQYADVVVLARELDLKMITDICDIIKKEKICGPSGNLVKIEVFAHGALCIAISGRCGMSLHNHNSSANRGACKQECRQSYRVIDEEDGSEMRIENKHIMSPNDICTIDFLDELVATGISVLKFEGRGRSPDYVDTVISCYKEALESIEKNTYNKTKIKKWMERLKGVYNRGFSDGYYLGRKQGWSRSGGSKATEEKVFVGLVERYFPKMNVAEAKLQASGIEKGDKLVITGRETGVERVLIDELRNEDEQIVSSLSHPSIGTFKTEGRVRKNDKIYKLKKRDV